jgi:ribonuclease D
MSHTHVVSAEQAADLAADLASASRFALDCEAAGFHRYSDRLCLLQLTVNDRTWVVDPLAFDPTALIKGPLEDPDVEVIMHGSDFDLRLLSRDLGIRLRGLVDTQIQAALIGIEGLGLAALLESRFGVKLSKKYQRADWAERPLTEGMLEYAASDTRYLERLTDLLAGELEALGRAAWAKEEWLALETVADERAGDVEPLDPVVRVKGARDLSPRQVTALREALVWRDEIARKRDRATFRVIGDPPLIEAVALNPRRAEELMDIKGFPRGLARDEGKGLLRRLRAVTEMSEDALTPYPRGVRRGPGRPPPELEEMVDKLKAARNQSADDVGLPRGTVLSNAVLIAVARAAPKTLDELLAVDGIRAWKAEVVGKRLLEITARG